MKCDKCSSERIAVVGGKTSDLCSVYLDGKEHVGYVPKGPFGEGDYIEFSLCMDCGKMQGKFPAKMRM